MSRPRFDGAEFGRKAALATLLALGLSLLVVTFTADGPDAISGGLGGDYPSFHAAGEIVGDDPGLDPETFYDPDTQFAAQEAVLPSDSTGNLYFAYPAFFVVPFVPLAMLGFELGYLADVVLMVAATALALRLLRPCSRLVRDHPLEVAAVALTFYPLFRGVSGGQNTAISLVLVAWFWRSSVDGRERSTGVAAALLLFKPPLALPFLGALVLARRWSAVATASATAVALYLVGALVTGPSWPAAWVDAVRYLDEIDTPFNVHNFVSLPGVAEAVFGIDSGVAAVAGLVFALAGTLVVSWAWWNEIGGLGDRVALTVVGALLISPHALYYDAGLLVIAVLALLERAPQHRRLVPVLWAGGLSHLAAESLGFSPVVLLVLACGGLVLWEIRPRRAAPTGSSRPDPSVA